MTATAINNALNALLFGDVWLFGFILIALLLLSLVMIKKEAAIISFPIAMILSIQYLDNGIGWGAICMFILVILLMFLVVKEK